jgi:putative endonuclease
MVGSKENEKMLWQVYLLRCVDKTLYCGITNDIARRIEKHNAGKGAKYTRSRLPVTLMAASRGLSKSDALTLERCIKRQPAGRKIAMVQRRS